MKPYLFLLLLMTINATAELKMSRIFSDNMILQQKQKNAVWGWTAPGKSVTVKASWGASENTVAAKDGHWRVFLETPKFGTGYSLSISNGSDTVKLKDVAIGEVWLCVGQSNMGWTVGGSFEKEKESSVNLPDLRIINSPAECSFEPLDIARSRLGGWAKCDAAKATETSAVSYYFAKKIHLELGIPVGIIIKAYSGTPIEGWMPREIQLDDPRTLALIEEKKNQDKLWISRAKSDRNSLIKEFEQKLIEYNQKIDAGDTTIKIRNKTVTIKAPSVRGIATHAFQFPGNIYNAMIHPVRGYGIKGMIWYQGERNSKYADQAVNYRRQLTLLVKYYRDSWHKFSGGHNDANFPVQFTQLPSWNSPQTNPVEGHEATWAINREMMRLVTKEVPNTYIAVSIDTGDEVLLHPMNKKPIGLRHASLALKNSYGKNLTASGPRYKTLAVSGNILRLQFDSIGSGLMAAQKGKLNAFAVAGMDRVWYAAEARIEGNSVIVHSSNVTAPVAVRYAWAMNPSRRNLLYNREGLPASPFRTDDWPLFEKGETLPKVNKPRKPKNYKPADWKRPMMAQ